MIRLSRIKRNDSLILPLMAVHYSQPKGFVGRNICYAISYEDKTYGAIVGGSTPKYLPGRDYDLPLNWICNNIFFHIEGPYPVRNFAQKVLREYRLRIEDDWYDMYEDIIFRHESLVELPRTGEVYKRDGWTNIGTTKGYTCKREGGYGTDSWSGKRVWNTTNLRPKLVFSRVAG